MRVLFASDVHLSAHRPQRANAFIEFLNGPGRECDRLVLLGDVFDEWLGDDDERPPHPQTCDALAAVSAAGVAVDFVTGNHDFLIGDRFLERTGCRRRGDEARVDVGGQTVLALHGDTLCTRDEGYQRWRRTFTDIDNQQRFLALPFAVREQQAAGARHESMRATRLKTEDIMDVTQDAVLDAMRRHGVVSMVHGHTHRPGRHRLTLDGVEAERFVLGDWYAEETVLSWDDDGPRLGSVRALFG